MHGFFCQMLGTSGAYVQKHLIRKICGRAWLWVILDSVEGSASAALKRGIPLTEYENSIKSGIFFWLNWYGSVPTPISKAFYTWKLLIFKQIFISQYNLWCHTGKPLYFHELQLKLFSIFTGVKTIVTTSTWKNSKRFWKQSVLNCLWNHSFMNVCSENARIADLHLKSIGL